MTIIDRFLKKRLLMFFTLLPTMNITLKLTRICSRNRSKLKNDKTLQSIGQFYGLSGRATGFKLC